ncbi:TetR/AcrR family transcriptional regulator [Microbacterium karelineae]|uniref:TetR/AcrR family transcriptional regulator n=1 Tax=Microbacterium karelineae TaxID=2654283 RepID=UPI0012EA7283|nr:TetR/AcrR family transcriptional regulator [Microbacterium karelineae]
MQEDTELPRGIALAWGVAANPQRGPKREMSVERIVETAVALADAEGIGAVSMAAVAKKLGFTPMSLYRYVSAKDDLLLLMQEEATGAPSLRHRDEEGWRAKLRVLFVEQVSIYLRHPWILALPISGSPITPNSSQWIEAGLEALDGAPLGEEEKLAIVLAITGQARWQGMVYAGYDQAARESGRTTEEISAEEHALYDRVIDGETYPRVRALVDAGAFLSEADPFRFGLERTLDGIEAYLDARGSGAPAALDRTAIEGVADVADDKRYRAAVRHLAATEKELRQAEKAVRQARRQQEQALREARARLD